MTSVTADSATAAISNTTGSTPQVASINYATATIDELTDYFLSYPVPQIPGESSTTPARLLKPVEIPSKIDNILKLQYLIQRRAWSDVLQLVESLLYGTVSSYLAPIYATLVSNISNEMDELALDSHKTELVWVMLLQIKALTKLKFYNKLKIQLETWTFCFHHHHDYGKAPKWIPWTFHITVASCLYYTSSSASYAIDELWKIRDYLLLLQNSSTSALSVPNATALVQVENALANIFIADKQFRMSLECYERMIDYDNETNVLSILCQDEIRRNHRELSNVDYKVVQKVCQSELLSRQGRILLQVGAVKEADEIYQRAADLWKLIKKTDNSSINHFAFQIVPIQLSINHGLLSFANASYNDAMQSFRSAIDSIRTIQKKYTASLADLPNKNTERINNVFIESPLFLSLDDVSIQDYLNTIYSETINNIALCALYTCQLLTALETLETLVRENPTAYLTDRIAMNLCTLYELGSDSIESSRKKKVLQNIAQRFVLQDVGQESFRIA